MFFRTFSIMGYFIQTLKLAHHYTVSKIPIIETKKMISSVYISKRFFLYLNDPKYCKNKKQSLLNVTQILACLFKCLQICHPNCKMHTSTIHHYSYPTEDQQS